MIVVVPTAREIRLEYLGPLIEAGARFIIVDDSVGRVKVNHPQFRVYNWGHQDRDLGELAKAIPRGNGACRDYGFLIAWRESEPREVIVALDDDCLVGEAEWARDAELALSESLRPCVLTRERHWNVLDLYEGTPSDIFPRGFPYRARVDYAPRGFGDEMVCEPMFHLGLWRGVFDVNAVDKLEGPAYEYAGARLRAPSVVVPRGALVSACSMNMVFRRELIPAVYQLPMAVDVMPGWRIDRYGDIWGGFITKALMDLRGDDFAVGAPIITHLKEGNCLRNVWQEHICHLVNDEFIALVDAFSAMRPPKDGSYLDLMGRLAEFIGRTEGSPLLRGYLRRLTRCMDAWVRALAVSS